MFDSFRVQPHAGRGPVSANDRFKAQYRSIFLTGIVAAALVHGIVFLLSPALGLLPTWLSSAEPLTVVPPAHVEPAPNAPPRVPPPLPEIVAGASSEDVPIPPEPLVARPFDAPVGDFFRDLTDGPTFTPYEIAPELRNRDAVVDALLRLYPYDSPGAPDRVRAVLWFLIDDRGIVRRALIQESTGHPAVDDAVRKVAALMEFTPAWSGDRSVPVWITLPLVFQIRPDEPVAADTMVVGAGSRGS